MMKCSQKGLDIIKSFEGLRLKAYQDQIWVWTIGYGTTYYADGRKVKMGDVITKEQAEAELRHYVNDKCRLINEALKNCLNQNQYDAICSFVYNLGIGAFNKSTLLKKINVNPDDPMIKGEFMKWVKAGGRTLPGLIKRRAQEAEIYFEPIV